MLTAQLLDTTQVVPLLELGQPGHPAHVQPRRPGRPGRDGDVRLGLRGLLQRRQFRPGPLGLPKGLQVNGVIFVILSV